METSKSSFKLNFSHHPAIGDIQILEISNRYLFKWCDSQISKPWDIYRTPCSGLQNLDSSAHPWSVQLVWTLWMWLVCLDQHVYIYDIWICSSFWRTQKIGSILAEVLGFVLNINDVWWELCLDKNICELFNIPLIFHYIAVKSSFCSFIPISNHF